MRYILLALLLLQVFSPVVQAQRSQRTEEWESGCDAQVLPQIVSVEGSFDFSAACEIYLACTVDFVGLPICQLSALGVLLQACTADDSHCQKSAVLSAATIAAFEAHNPDVGISYYLPFDEMLEFYPLGLSRFQEGDTQGALSAFESIPTDQIPDSDFYYAFQPMRDLIIAFLYAELGQPDIALNLYDEIDSQNLDAPLMRYLRVQLYGELGENTRAAIDAEWLRQYTSGYPEAEAVVVPLLAMYPLDTTRFESWMAYPLISTSDGSGGPSARMTLQEPAYPLDTSFRDETEYNFVVLLGMSPFRFDEATPRASILLLEREENRINTYSIFYYLPEGLESSFRVTVSVLREDLISLNSSMWVFEGGGSRQSLLVPAGDPDPRLAFEGYCGVISRIRHGMTAYVDAYYDGEVLDLFYNEPNGVGSHYEGQVTVIGESQCIEEQLWWPVQDENGESGWVPENEGTQYTLHPWRDQRTIDVCPNSLPSRLFVNATARVISGLGANNLRSIPSEDAELLTQIPEGTEITIIGSQICVNGITWWYVSFNEQTGWTAEGQGENYWLEPIFD